MDDHYSRTVEDAADWQRRHYLPDWRDNAEEDGRIEAEEDRYRSRRDEEEEGDEE